jgi:hypothetical protein
MHAGYPHLWEKHAKGTVPGDYQVGSAASKVIGAIKQEVETEQGGRWPWKYWTKQSMCAEALYEHGGNVNNAVMMLVPKLGACKALTFTENIGGKRTPLSQHRQVEALRRQINAVKANVDPLLGGKGKEQKEQEPPKDDGPKHHPLLVWIRTSRDWLATRKADGHEIDEWGLRQAEYGARMLKAGISLEAIKHAATLHFPPEARKALGVKDYDVTSFRKGERREGMHAALPYVMALVHARIPVAMVGPKGTGKTTLAGHVAQVLELPFGMVSMTSATSPSAFNGRPKIGGDGGVVTSQFERIFSGGGVFLFDEMDAADQNLLLLVNAALANGQFSNAATGEIVERHPDFIPMAGMNTLGLGAGRDYVGREKLDAATLDRWNMGRVQIRLDERVEESLFYGILGENEKENQENNG